MTRHDFDVDTAVTETEPGVFTGHIHERWTIMNVPNGGYVMALPLNAARAVSNHPDPFTATAHFLSPTSPGPVDVVTEVVKAGRSTTTVAARVAQEGRERLRLLVTLGDMTGRTGPTHSFRPPPALEGPFSTGRSMLPQEFAQNFKYRVPESVAGGAFGRPNGRPEVGGTIEFADGRPPDLLAMPVLADGFPPVAFNLGHAAWTPTLELTVHFWNHPAPGPVTAWIETGTVEGGLHDETADLWDSTGRLVARSRQLAMILGAG